MKKVPRREGKRGKDVPRGTLGMGPPSLRSKAPGGEYKIAGARGYAAGGKALFSPAAFLIALLAGGGAVASALLQRFGVLEPAAARWVLYAGVILAGLLFLWEGRRRLMDDSKRKKRDSLGNG